MARAATTTDAFNAVGDPHRREILTTLGTGALAVHALVDALALPQPQVSKHLKVLRDVGLVRCDRVGRRRVYRVNGAALRPMHDWLRTFEALWNERYDRLDDLLTELQPSRSDPTHGQESRTGLSAEQTDARAARDEPSRSDPTHGQESRTGLSAEQTDARAARGLEVP